MNVDDVCNGTREFIDASESARGKVLASIAAMAAIELDGGEGSKEAREMRKKLQRFYQTLMVFDASGRHLAELLEEGRELQKRGEQIEALTVDYLEQHFDG